MLLHTVEKEVGADHYDLLRHTEARWLSRDKCISRLFELHHEIIEFLRTPGSCKDSAELPQYLEDKDFIIDMAFLADVTQHLNLFNVSLQGKNKSICDLLRVVNEFMRRFSIIFDQFQQCDFQNFTRTAKFNLAKNSAKHGESLAILGDLKTATENHFKDFEKIYHLVE